MSAQIRQKLCQVVSRLKRYIETNRLQPRKQDLQQMDLPQLQRVLRDNWTNHDRLVKLLGILIQLDISWAALIIGSPFERRQKRIFVERYGNYGQLMEPSQHAIRNSKALYEAALPILLSNYPDHSLPLNFNIL